MESKTEINSLLEFIEVMPKSEEEKEPLKNTILEAKTMFSLKEFQVFIDPTKISLYING